MARSAWGLSGLVVEDHADLRDVVAQTLRHLGLSVRTAASAEDAALLCDASLPAVVITDVQLPGASGIALVQRLRSTYGKRCPRIVLLSAVLPEDWRSIDGVVAGLRKPCSVATLRETVRRALEVEPIAGPVLG